MTVNQNKTMHIHGV